MLTYFKILCGFGWGVFATIGPAYASEIVPLSLRGYLTSYVNLCWAIGQFIAAGVLEGLVNRTDQWGYRIPFAVQWVWPLPLMLLCWFAPESPWYKVRNDRLEDAQKILKRISRGVPEENLNGTLAMMVHTTKIEERTESSGSYIQCFKGTDRRRTEICCVVFVGQLMSGSCFAYTPTYCEFILTSLINVTDKPSSLPTSRDQRRRCLQDWSRWNRRGFQWYHIIVVPPCTDWSQKALWRWHGYVVCAFAYHWHNLLCKRRVRCQMGSGSSLCGMAFCLLSHSRSCRIYDRQRDVSSPPPHQDCLPCQKLILYHEYRVQHPRVLPHQSNTMEPEGQDRLLLVRHVVHHLRLVVFQASRSYEPLIRRDGSAF